MADTSQVVLVRDVGRAAIDTVASRYAIALEWRDAADPIENSWWGAPEAGISHDGVRLRADTPVHSLLHELCHIVCMSAQRRQALWRNAGGTAAEECAVCYLQVLLADTVPSFGAARCLADMDAWGYSFREGSAAAWFDGDGQDARDWLHLHELIDAEGRPTFHLRS